MVTSTCSSGNGPRITWWGEFIIGWTEKRSPCSSTSIQYQEERERSCSRRPSSLPKFGVKPQMQSAVEEKAATRRPRPLHPLNRIATVHLTGSVVTQEFIHKVLQGIRWTCEIELCDPACPHVLRATEVDPVLPQVKEHLNRKITDLWV